LATVSIVAVAVYLIIVLIQLKKTVKEMEGTLSRVNAELDMVNKVSGKVVNITEKLSNPLISACTVLYYIFSSFKKRKGGCKEEKNV
jgi:uncharacterized protein YoxC